MDPSDNRKTKRDDNLSAPPGKKAKTESSTEKFMAVEDSVSAQQPPKEVSASVELLPRTVADVQAGLKLAHQHGHAVHVRSGINCAAESHIDAPDGVLFNLRRFASIEDGADNEVVVKAAATVGAVAAWLDERHLYLPLGDDPNKAIASLLLGAAAGSPARRDEQSLAKHVAFIRYVDSAGEAHTVASDAVEAKLADGVDGVVTEIGFRRTPVAERWLTFWSVPFDGGQFEKLLAALSESAAVFADGVEWSVRVREDVFQSSTLNVRLVGQQQAQRGAAEAAVAAALTTAGAHSAPQRAEGNVMSALAATGVESAALNRHTVARFAKDVVASGELFSQLAGVAALALQPHGAQDIDEVTLRSLEVRLRDGGRLHCEIDAFTRTNTCKKWLDFVAAATKVLPPVAHVRATALRDAEPATLTSPLVLREALPMTMLSLGDAMRVTTPRAAIIPNFKGVVYLKSENSVDYQESIQQYARSSVADAATRMSPFLVAYPRDESDVSAAILYAAQHGKKVVARSGGHHYSGMSSGGDDTVLLSMDKFKRLQITGTVVECGVGIVLQELSTALKNANLSMPHGECPLVGIGGHVQTGGLGHLMHSFGLALDCCVSFRMVTADGVAAEYARGSDVYAAVLGGGPGSFGVLTSLRFECLPDTRYSHAYGYKATLIYSKSIMTAAFAQWCKWTQLVDSDSLPPGVDFALTVTSGVNISEVLHGNLPRPATVLVECIGTGEDQSGGTYFRQFVDPIAAKASVLTRFVSYDGPGSLSAMVDSIVRTEGVGTTRQGREFSYPFKKRVVVFLSAMSGAFATDFAALVDKTMAVSGLKVVVQMLAGGGKYKKPPAGVDKTHAQWRSLSFALVFDVFYNPGSWLHASREQEALAAQAEMRALMNTHNIGDRRMFWGSYEEKDDENELHLDNMVAQYFDSADEYAKLQAIKASCDANDLFHTMFTVQLPQ